MRVPIILEDVGAAEPIRVSCWLAEPGESIGRGERVVELSLPSLILDVAAPAAGVLEQIVLPRRSMATPGDILGWIDTSESEA